MVWLADTLMRERKALAAGKCVFVAMLWSLWCFPPFTLNRSPLSKEMDPAHSSAYRLNRLLIRDVSFKCIIERLAGKLHLPKTHVVTYDSSKQLVYISLTL